MDYNNLIRKALEKNEILQLLRGEKGYEVLVSEFSPDIFPTDINTILINCFYKQNGKIEGINDIFVENLAKLIEGEASDLYTAILYFDACIFQEEREKATFKIKKELLADDIRKAVNKQQKQLKDSIVFPNGMIKQIPWKNIENFNKYYEKNIK